ncbi:MAG: hypothetical protein ACRDA3_13190 [Peptostreptococcaceae bacterium]
MQYVYKIRNRDGSFSSGLTDVKWSEGGKCWSSLRNLRLHLKVLSNKIDPSHPDYPYHNCSIVRFKIEEDEVLEVIK